MLDVPRYVKVADRIASLVERGTFPAGRRIPSVRRLADELDVSVTTVLEAYRVLEDRGLIEPRPRSGYFVRARALAPVPEPCAQPSATEAALPEVGAMVLRLVHELSRPDLVPLGAAVPSPELLPTAKLSRHLAAVAREEAARAQAYEPLPGYPPLRALIARRLLAAGCTVAPDDVVITSGAQEAVELSLRAVTKPGDVVAVETPTYYGLLQAVESLHLRALEIATDPRDGLDLDAVERALAAGPIGAFLLVPTHGNPLGHSMPEDNRERLVARLAKSRIPIVEDDTYGDLPFGPRRPSALKAFDRAGDVLLCGTFSKTLAPGYRVGWAVPGRARAEVERLKFGASVAAASPTQLAIARYLQKGGFDRELKRLRRLYRELAERMTRAVVEHFPEGTRVSRPSGGHVLWVEMPEGVDSFRLHEDALAVGVSLAPGPLFSPSGRYRNAVRLNCAYPWSERIDQGLRAVGGLARRQLESSSTAPPLPRSRPARAARSASAKPRSL